MVKYVFNRFVLMIVTFFVIISIVFIGTRTAQISLYTTPHPIIEDVKIAFQMYKIYLHNVFYEGDYGETLLGFDIKDIMIYKIPVSMKVLITALLFYIPVGVLFGVLSAYFKGSWFDKIVGGSAALLSGIPSYILMFFFVLVLGYKLEWFPAIYDQSPTNLWDQFKNLAMPVTALTIVPLATTIRIMRAEVSEEMDKEYILLLRTKGLTKWQCITRHAIRNCVAPVIQDITFTFGIMLSMSFIIEMTYNINGIAYLFYQAMIVPSIDGNYLFIDTNVAVAVSAVYVAVLLVVGFIVDISLALLDPRVNIKGKKV